MSQTVLPPFIPYLDLSGNALQNGRLFIGQANQLAQVAPLTVYWDRALTQPAAQPLQTTNGYIARTGTPANVFFSGNDYSITIIDSQGVTVFSTLSALASGFIDLPGGAPIVPITPSVNLLQNTFFGNNSRKLTSPVTLVAGEQGHDQYYGGAAGCTYSFTTANNNTLISISAGSLLQSLAGNQVFSGSHTLSWSGSAQARLNGGAYSASPVSVSALGGQPIACEWTGGTVENVQLQTGNQASSWIPGIDYYLFSGDVTDNILINAQMLVNQEATGNVVANNAYFVDGWQLVLSAVPVRAFKNAQSPSIALAGYYLNACGTIQAGSAYPALGASDFAAFQQPIEGFNFRKIAQADARLSFWAQASTPGVYSVALRSAAVSQSIVFEFSLLDTNWHFIEIQIPPSPDVPGFSYDNSGAAILSFTLAAGTSVKTPLLNQWQAGNFLAGTNQTNGAATINSALNITAVQLGYGNNFAVNFLRRDYEEELERCQRYFQFINVELAGYSLAGNGLASSISFLKPMRIVPAVSLTGGAAVNTAGPVTSVISDHGVNINAVATITGTVACTGYTATCNARL